MWRRSGGGTGASRRAGIHTAVVKKAGLQQRSEKRARGASPENLVNKRSACLCGGIGGRNKKVREGEHVVSNVIRCVHQAG